MGRQELELSWSVTRTHLDEARRLLPATPCSEPDGSTLDRYEDWLDHNELELALDELADIGRANRPGAPFWECLSRAATNMGLHDKAALYQRQGSDPDAVEAWNP